MTISISILEYMTIFYLSDTLEKFEYILCKRNSKIELMYYYDKITYKKQILIQNSYIANNQNKFCFLKETKKIYSNGQTTPLISKNNY